jgi:hypothetical protein
MIAPLGQVNQQALAKLIAEAQATLGPQVEHLFWRIEEDHTGEPSLKFRIVLTDEGSRRETLATTTGKIVQKLFDVVQPYDWGLRPYYTVRSASEHSRLIDPAWS